MGFLLRKMKTPELSKTELLRTLSPPGRYKNVVAVVLKEKFLLAPCNISHDRLIFLKYPANDFILAEKSSW